MKFSTDWSTPPKEVWRRAVGPGHSSLCLVGDVLFTQEQSGGDELVTCYSALTGEPIWVNSIKYDHNDVQGGEGPRATPSYANGKVYTQSAGALLQCLDAATGKVIWKQDLSTKENPDPPIWGYSSSPLVVGDVVIQHSTGAGRKDMAAFDADRAAVLARAVETRGLVPLRSRFWAVPETMDSVASIMGRLGV